MVEVLRSMKSFPQSSTILDMGAKTQDAGVENIAQGVLPQEDIAQHSHTLTHFPISPQLPEFSNCTDISFLAPRISHQLGIRNSAFFHGCPGNGLVLQDKVENALSEVLGNIFGVVLNSTPHHLFRGSLRNVTLRPFCTQLTKKGWLNLVFLSLLNFS